MAQLSAILLLQWVASTSVVCVTSDSKIISAEWGRVCCESLKMETNPWEFKQHVWQVTWEPKLTLTRSWQQNKSESLKSWVLRGTEAWRGAGIPQCLEIVTGFSVLHISFPIKWSKFPQLLHLPTTWCTAEHRTLSASTRRWCGRNPKKGSARKIPSEMEALK